MKYLNKYYSRKTNQYRTSPAREEKIIELIKEPLKNKKILDIGCSGGEFGVYLRKRGAHVTGVDISSKFINEAKKNLDKAHKVDLNDGKLPFKNNQFDLVIASEVLEHLFRPNRIIKESKRVIKKGGKIVFSTPNLLYWGNRINFLKGKFKYTDSGVFDESHIHFYTYQTFIEDIKLSGLEIYSENHVYRGSNILGIKSKFPSIFAYQFVVLCSK